MNSLLKSRELRAQAKDQLLGNYATAVGSFALLFAFQYLIMALSEGGLINLLPDMKNVSDIAFILITDVLGGITGAIINLFVVGFIYVLRCISYGGKPNRGDMFFAFRHHPDKVIILYFISYVIQMILLLPVDIISTRMTNLRTAPLQQIGALSIAGIVGSIIYLIYVIAASQSYLLYLEDPESDVKSYLFGSFAMMKGFKWRYFCLICSFFGYILLIVLSLGIAALWIMPIVEMAGINFYRMIKGDRQE